LKILPILSECVAFSSSSLFFQGGKLLSLGEDGDDQ
jgi:hypothetical protein